MENADAEKLLITEALRPVGLLSCICDCLTDDLTGRQPDLVDTCWEYFDQMVHSKILSTDEEQQITLSRVKHPRENDSAASIRQNYLSLSKN